MKDTRGADRFLNSIIESDEQTFSQTSGGLRAALFCARSGRVGIQAVGSGRDPGSRPLGIGSGRVGSGRVAVLGAGRPPPLVVVPG